MKPNFYYGLLTNGRGWFFPLGERLPDREVDHSHQFCDVVKNLWSSTLISYIRLRDLRVRQGERRILFALFGDKKFCKINVCHFSIYFLNEYTYEWWTNQVSKDLLQADNKQWNIHICMYVCVFLCLQTLNCLLANTVNFRRALYV